MIEFLIWATAYLAIGGFCAQICYGKMKGSCTERGHKYCTHEVWYFTALLGFFMPMAMLGVILAKKSKLDLTEREHYELKLEEATQRANIAEENEREVRAQSQSRIAEIEGLNAELETLRPGWHKPVKTDDLR